MKLRKNLGAVVVAVAVASCAGVVYADDIRAVVPANAPEAIGPYSHGIRAGNTVYVSGQLPTDASGKLHNDAPIDEQTRLVLNNIKNVLAAEELTMDNVVATTVYMKDLDEFSAMNEAYATFFTEGAPPARATVQVARLPRDVSVEIGAIAVKP